MSPLGYALATETITSNSALSSTQAEDVVVAKALEAYDSASNGNKTRGGIKKANDM